ncbi:MAG: RNA methyltransferase [Muribaculaceae bacterium]|nr:RNA methyltransferase [Muribaculaceae bacterium]
MVDNFQMVAKTFQGLEDVLRDELISLGAENVEMGRRMVSFEGDLAMMYRANLCCRTALRILKPIEKFTAKDPDELYDIVRDIEWEKYMTPDTTFSIDSTVNSDEFTHSKYVTYRVKDGIVDHFRDKYGERPSIRVSGADLMLNVHIFDDRITISLDSSGEPLSKRGYRVEQTAAPINEVLAAGIIMKTGWRGDCNFADPMCGSGTFLIEAALIAANINPGIYRKQFAFEKWPDFDRELFEDIYNDDSAEREFTFKIYGGDIDPEAVSIARKNVREAKVEDMVELMCRPMSDWIDNPEPGIIVMNPPYGERLKSDDLVALFKGIGTCLKKNFSGWTAWLIGPDNEDFGNIGLKPTLKIPLLNGSLECSLREYVLFDGRYDEFRESGGSLGKHADEEMQRERPRKMKHVSDDEWKKETRKFGNHDRKPNKKNGAGKFSQERSRKMSGDSCFDGERFSTPEKFHGPKKFEHSDRKPSRNGDKPFRKDDKSFRKDDKRFRGGDNPFRKDSKPFERRQKPPVTPTSKGPSLPESDEYRFSEYKLRSRRPKQSDE